MVKTKQMHRAGTVIVLGKRLRHGGQRQLCRVYARWPYYRCGLYFTSSVVCEYSLSKYRSTGGVGPTVTPEAQRPRWHDACRQASQRSPLLHQTCKCGCGTAFTTNNPQKVYLDADHRKAAAAKRRAPAEPSIVFELDDEQQAAVNAMMGIDADRDAMEASARRFKGEVDAEVRERRLRADPGFAAAEHVRQEQEAQVWRLCEAEDALHDAEVVLAEAVAKVESLAATPDPVSPARAELEALDAALEVSAAERASLSEIVRLSTGPFSHNIRDIHNVEQVKAQLDLLTEPERKRPQVAQAVEDAPAWEAQAAAALDAERRSAIQGSAEARRRRDAAQVLVEGVALAVAAVAAQLEEIAHVDESAVEDDEDGNACISSPWRAGDDEARGRQVRQSCGTWGWGEPHAAQRTTTHVMWVWQHERSHCARDGGRHWSQRISSSRTAAGASNGGCGDAATSEQALRAGGLPRGRGRRNNDCVVRLFQVFPPRNLGGGPCLWRHPNG